MRSLAGDFGPLLPALAFMSRTGLGGEEGPPSPCADAELDDDLAHNDAPDEITEVLIDALRGGAVSLDLCAGRRLGADALRAVVTGVKRARPTSLSGRIRTSDDAPRSWCATQRTNCTPHWRGPRPWAGPQGQAGVEWHGHRRPTTAAGQLTDWRRSRASRAVGSWCRCCRTHCSAERLRVSMKPGAGQTLVCYGRDSDGASFVRIPAPARGVIRAARTERSGPIGYGGHEAMSVGKLSWESTITGAIPRFLNGGRPADQAPTRLPPPPGTKATISSAL